MELTLVYFLFQLHLVLVMCQKLVWSRGWDSIVICIFPSRKWASKWATNAILFQEMLLHRYGLKPFVWDLGFPFCLQMEILFIKWYEIERRDWLSWIKEPFLYKLFYQLFLIYPTSFILMDSSNKSSKNSMDFPLGFPSNNGFLHSTSIQVLSKKLSRKFYSLLGWNATLLYPYKMLLRAGRGSKLPNMSNLSKRSAIYRLTFS